MASVFISAVNGWRPSVICGRPLGKRFYFGGERLAAFGHMSGLLARTGSAGPDEVRRPSAPDQGSELRAPDPLRSVRWSSIVSPCRSYVDGPLASVFISAVNGWRPSVICPACWRGRGPLALMKSDDPRLPIKGASFGLLTHCGVSDGLRSSRRVVHHVVVALAKLLSLRSPSSAVLPIGIRPWRRWRCGRPRRW